MLKRIVSEIKDANDFVSMCFYLVKILPTSDQFNMIMFDNIYVKNKPSYLGHKNTVFGSLRKLLFHFLTDGFHNWHNDCLWRVEYNEDLEITNMTLDPKVKVK